MIGRVDEQSRRAIDAFRQRFGVLPAVVASAPGRVNIVGEHVDYAGGVVLPMPIAERTAVAMAGARATGAGASAARRSAGVETSRIVSLELGGDAVAEAPAPAQFEPFHAALEVSWLNAAMGPLRALSDEGIDLPAIHAVIASDVPIGAGLSSSASLGVAMAAAALRLVGAEISPNRLAPLLQEAERRFVGTPCGVMDMMTALAASDGSALRLDCRSLETESIPLPADLRMLLIDSGVRHALARSAYAERRAQVEQAAARLGIASLRDADPSMIERSDLPEILRRRARHVVTELRRVDLACEALHRADLARLGRIVSESHASLRDDFEVSVPEVDRIVRLAHQARPAALGARMVGGGFGGSVLVVTTADAAPALRRTLESLGLGAAPHGMREVRAGSGYTAAAAEDRPS